MDLYEILVHVNRLKWRQGQHLSSTARRIVNSVSKFMTMEKRGGRSILRMNVVECVAQACQIQWLGSSVKQKNNEGNFRPIKLHC